MGQAIASLPNHIKSKNMKTIKNTKLILQILFINLIILSCTTEENDEMNDNVDNNPVSSISKNTIANADASGELNYYYFSNYNQGNGEIFEFTVYENTANTNLGTYLRIMMKSLPTATTTFMHRQEGNFDLETGEYFLNLVRIGGSGNEEWYVPFVNSRITNELKVTVENGVATFTVEDAELSDNFVNPITATKNFSLSFSININELVVANSGTEGTLVD